MNQSGRVSLVAVLGVVAVVVVTALLFMSRESLTSLGGRFMTALSKGDVDTLTEMSYLGNRTPQQIRDEWTFTTKTAGKYYNFRYRITSAREADDKSATVTMMVERDIDSGSSYEEKRELPLVKVGNDWKVDVANISRDVYPSLPR